MFQMKEQDKTPEESDMEIGNLSKKEFRVMTVKMIKELGRRMDTQSEKSEIFNKELENIKNNQTELKNTITEIKIFIYRLLYKNLMVTTNQKSIIDVHTKKKNNPYITQKVVIKSQEKRIKGEEREKINTYKTINKLEIRTHISIITLNVNELNVPTKRHRVAEWIQKQYPYICYLPETHFRSRDTHKLKVRG